jgi:hypothetical protein
MREIMLSALFLLQVASSAVDVGHAARVPIYVSGFVCPSQRGAFLKAAPSSPTVLVSEERPGSPARMVPVESTLEGRADESFTMRLPAGSYKIAMAWPFGGGSIAATVLDGHPRNLSVSLCNSSTLNDSDRNIAGTLPASGLALDLVAEKAVLPVTIDNGAYYATHLPLGSLRLRVYFSSAQTYCDFAIPSSGQTEWQQIRLDLTKSMIDSCERLHL